MKYPLFFLCALLFIMSLQSCKSKNVDTALDNSLESNSYYQKGKEITTAAFKVLSSNLQESIKQGGIQEAISYCNLNASPLVDSLSKEYNSSIRRTSFKVRNTKNVPTSIEKQYLTKYTKKFDDGEILDPVIIESKESVTYFAPIMINNFCLQCHGHPGNTLSDSDYLLIKEHYPDDKAIGYNDGDLRGMWSLSFSKND